MEEVYKGKNGGCLCVGSDEDYWKAATREWFICTAAKEGPHGHRSMLGYTGQAAPKGPNYLWVEKGKHLALNLIDSDDPNFISDGAIKEALKFIAKHVGDGHKVLVQCNQGISRSPSIAFLYLRMINDLPERYHPAFKIFKTLYPKYSPNQGMEHYVKNQFKELR